MAEQLVNDMADAWSPDLFHDEFKEKLNALVQAVGKSEFICRSSLGESCPYTLGSLRRADTRRWLVTLSGIGNGNAHCTWLVRRPRQIERPRQR